MHPVTNEDWRSQAFSLILDASASLPLQDRDEIQRLGVRAAVQALGDEQFQFDQFGESLARPPWTESNAEWALAEWFDAKATSDGSRVDRCIEIIVTGLEYWSADADWKVIDGFVRHLETMGTRPSHLHISSEPLRPVLRSSAIMAPRKLISQTCSGTSSKQKDWWGWRSGIWHCWRECLWSGGWSARWGLN
jgi:hypothetical protein